MVTIDYLPAEPNSTFSDISHKTTLFERMVMRMHQTISCYLNNGQSRQQDPLNRHISICCCDSLDHQLQASSNFF
jgi:hypothetical protein